MESVDSSSAAGGLCTPRLGLTLFRSMVGKMFVEFAEFTWCVLSRANLTPADEANSDSNSVPTLATRFRLGFGCRLNSSVAGSVPTKQATPQPCYESRHRQIERGDRQIDREGERS